MEHNKSAKKKTKSMYDLPPIKVNKNNMNLLNVSN